MSWLRELNPFWSTPLLKTAREGDFSPADAVALAPSQLTQEELDATADGIEAFVRQRSAMKGKPRHSFALLSYMFLQANKTQMACLTTSAILLSIFRIANNVCFAQLMAVLGGSSTHPVFPGQPLPPLAVTVALFCCTTLGATLFNYLMDMNGKILGTRCRVQIAWTVHRAVLSTTLTKIGEFADSEVISVACIDAMTLRDSACNIFYILVVPLELIALVLLIISQVSVGAAFIGLSPAIIVFIFKIIMMKIASPHLKHARCLNAERFGVLGEAGIKSNFLIKLFGTEDLILRAVKRLRKQEEKELLWIGFSESTSIWMQVLLPALMTIVALLAEAVLDPGATLASTMTVLGFFKTICTFSMFRIMVAFHEAMLALVGCEHIYEFLAAAWGTAAADPNAAEPKADDNTLINIENASFCWNDDSEPLLKNINLNLPRGKLIGVTGPIGSGKSSLLFALLKELEQKSGKVMKHPDWSKAVGFSTQQAWIQTGTVRQNICFALPAEEMSETEIAAWLERVCTACGLQTDIQGFENGLDSDVGVAGSSLSGGQKARLSLARAVFAKTSISILDDPLCALDPVLAEEVFKNVIAPGGLLHGPGRSVLLVCSNLVQLAQCDEVVVKDGSIAGVGTLEKMTQLGLVETTQSSFNVQKQVLEESFNPLLDNSSWRKSAIKSALVDASYDMLGLFSSRDSMAYGSIIDIKDSRYSSTIYPSNSVLRGTTRGKLNRHTKSFFGDIAEEEVTISFKQSRINTQNVKKDLEIAFHNGNKAASRQLLNLREEEMRGNTFFVDSLCCDYGGNADGLAGKELQIEEIFDEPVKRESENDEVIVGINIKRKGLFTAALIGLGTGVFLSGASLVISVVWVFLWEFSLKVTLNYVDNANQFGSTARISKILLAPILVFASRVQGHLSDDARLVELPLAAAVGAMWVLLTQLIGTVIIACISLPYLTIMFVPLCALYVYVQRIYSKASVPMTNTEAAARGPLMAALSTTLSGLPVVRAVQCNRAMGGKFYAAIRNSAAASAAVVGGWGWLNFICNAVIFGTISCAVSILLAVALQPGPGSLAPIAMSNVMSIGGIIGGAAMLVSKLETSMTALQRLLMYADLPEEEAVVRPSKKKLSQRGKQIYFEPSPEWPAVGSITYDAVTAAYTWSGPPALNGCSIRILGGTSCGFVGRSGSGKSTAFLALTGAIPILDGVLSIDGIDLRKVSLPTLRSVMAVVLQEPVLFDGSIRSNLDPHKEHFDADIFSVLRLVGMDEVIQQSGQGLELNPVSAGLSRGQRQLMCLTRALLRDTTILLLDEANASVDEETEEKLIKIVSDFVAGKTTVVGKPRKRTLIEVAHRLKSVLEMDQVVVLAAGHVIEAGVPTELAAENGSTFSGMVAAQQGES